MSPPFSRDTSYHLYILLNTLSNMTLSLNHCGARAGPAAPEREGAETSRPIVIDHCGRMWTCGFTFFNFIHGKEESLQLLSPQHSVSVSDTADARSNRSGGERGRRLLCLLRLKLRRQLWQLQVWRLLLGQLRRRRM